MAERLQFSFYYYCPVELIKPYTLIKTLDGQIIYVENYKLIIYFMLDNENVK